MRSSKSHPIGTVVVLLGIVSLVGCEFVEWVGREGITFTTDQAVYEAGSDVSLELSNSGSETFTASSLCALTLQRLTGRVWHTVWQQQACYTVLIEVKPGASEEFVVELPADLERGTYRYRLETAFSNEFTASDDMRCIRGEWINPPEAAYVDEPWERLAFHDADRYSRWAFNYFEAEWKLVAESLPYDLIDEALHMEDLDGSTTVHEIVSCADSTLVLAVGGVAATWRRPKNSDPGY